MRTFLVLVAIVSLGMATASPGQSADDPDPNDAEIERAHMRMALAAAAVVLGGFFLFVVIISFARITRARRRLLRIGKHNRGTEYVDAWSKYRLDEETDEQRPAGDE